MADDPINKKGLIDTIINQPLTLLEEEIR